MSVPAARAHLPLPGWLIVLLAAGAGALIAVAVVSGYATEQRAAFARAIALDEADDAVAAGVQLLAGSIAQARAVAAGLAAPPGEGGAGFVLGAIELRILPPGDGPLPEARILPGAPGGTGDRLIVVEPVAGSQPPRFASVTLPLPVGAIQARPAAIGVVGSPAAEVLPLAGLGPGGRWTFGLPPPNGTEAGRIVRPGRGEGLGTALAWRQVSTTRLTVLAAVPVPRLGGGGLLPWLAGLLGAGVGALVAALARSLAERRRLDEALTRAQREHDAAIRTLADRHGLETLGRLTAGVAHEIGNVMQAVEFYLRAMPGSLEDRAALQHLIERARGAARRGAAGARDLLALARGSARRPEPVDIAPLLTEIADVMQELLGDRFAVRLELPGELPQVLADAEDLEAMLINLATNSRDAMAPAGSGVLSLSATLVGSPDAPGAPAGLPGGEWVRIEIADTGVGMDAETLARAMEPFFTTKPRGRGTGLGLALAREFAERSGGMLQIESTPGAGTRARLFLHPASEGKVTPDAEPPADAIEPRSEQGGAPSRGRLGTPG